MTVYVSATARFLSHNKNLNAEIQQYIVTGKSIEAAAEFPNIQLIIHYLSL